MVWAGVAFHGFVRVTSHMEQSRKSLYVHVCVSVWLIIAKGGDNHLTAKVIVFLSVVSGKPVDLTIKPGYP